MQRAMHEVCIQVARRSGGDLQCLYSVSAYPRCVVFRLEVAFDDGDTELIAKRINRRFQQRGLACARRGHEIQGEYAVIIEVLAVMRSLTVVGRQQTLKYFDSGAICRRLIEQVGIARSDVTAAVITHVCSRSGVEPRGGSRAA